MTGVDLIIEQLAQAMNFSYVDAVVQFAQEHEIDVEDVVRELHSSTRKKIAHEFIERNMVRGLKHVSTLETFME